MMEGIDVIFSEQPIDFSGVMTDESIDSLRLRNEQKLKEAKARLGAKYLLAPENRAKRLTKFKDRRK